ncbi:MAG TPA: glycosyltransferase [Micromonosporaceae bacterium]|jgi:glycosyltransferase involved in cell wall biosynthesis|nr:glycosyltransferase [Micromonosporaceae bacterium]
MKVVIAHNRYSSAQPSGENVIVETEIAQLTAAGVTVVPFLRSSDEIEHMSPAGRAALPMMPIWAPSVQRELRELLASERPDVFHLHNPYPLLSPWVVRTAHDAGVPVVQTIHNYRHVCVAATFLRDGHVCHDCVGRRIATPAVRYSCYRGSRAQSVVMATSLAVHRGTWQSVDRFIALTRRIADFLRDFGIPDDRITVKPNAVTDPGEPPAAGTGSGALFLGRLSAEKGLDLLLAAWHRHPEGSLGVLRIVGDGPLRDMVRAAAASRSDVEYLGGTDNAGAQAAIRSAALVVVPSTWDDVLPTVIIESLANGRPVLGTAVGGIPYLVGDRTGDSAGWLVPPTAEALAAALPTALADAPARTAAARARYLAMFSPAVVLATLLGVYDELASTRR